MNVENLHIKISGHAYCKSGFYSCFDAGEAEYTFHSGVNLLEGEIDSFVWAVSYFASMYSHKLDDFTIDSPTIVLNGSEITIQELNDRACYLEKNIHPLFPVSEPVKDLVIKGLETSGKNLSADEIMEIFRITPSLYDRPLTGVGNEIFRATAAIGYANGRDVFCFPWLSRKRFEYYHGNIKDVLEILESLGMLVILPIGNG